MHLTQIAPLVTTPLIARARRFWRRSNAGHSKTAMSLPGGVRDFPSQDEY